MSNILIIENEKIIQQFLCNIAINLGCEPICVNSLQDGLSLLRTNIASIDIVIHDIFSPFEDSSFNSDDNSLKKIIDSTKVCFEIFLRTHSIPDFIIIDRFNHPDGYRYSIQIGAIDYINIPYRLMSLDDFDNIKNRVINAINNCFAKKNKLKSLNLQDIVWFGFQMKKAIWSLAQAIDTDENVIIYGEKGVGKRLFAQIIHQNSARKDNHFVIYNCYNERNGLIDRKLFGFGKEIGAIEKAHTGTLVLNEINNLPLSAQNKLVDAIEEKYYLRRPQKEKVPFDVRIISTATQNLFGCVKRNNFNYDLYYKINKLFLDIPPLIERTEDINELVKFFIKQMYDNKEIKVMKEVDNKIISALKTYYWPGNLLELRNVIKVAFIESKDSEKVKIVHLPFKLKSAIMRAGYRDMAPIDSHFTCDNLIEVKEFIRTDIVELPIPYIKFIAYQDVNEKIYHPSFISGINENNEASIPTFSFYKKGDIWLMGEEGKEVQLSKKDGYDYIHFLLINSRNYLPAIHVYHLGIPPDFKDDIESYINMLGYKMEKSFSDKQAIMVINSEVNDLKDKYDIEHNKITRLEIEDEIKSLKSVKNVIEKLKSDEAEQARINVRKAIKSALKEIHSKVPILKDYLNEKTIETGRDCSYIPSPGREANWKLRP